MRRLHHKAQHCLPVSRLLFTIYCLLLCLLAVGAVSAQGETDIAITGQVTNGTPGGSLPVGDPVVLRFFSGDAWTDRYTTTLEADGSYTFVGLGQPSGAQFLTQLTYQGVDYLSELAQLEGGPDPVAVNLQIFETTTDRANVVVDQAHIFIVRSGEQVQVAEYYLVGNRGDRSYVGEEGADARYTTLHFSLPPEATDLNFDGPGLDTRYVGDAYRFADTRPVLPGAATTEIGFGYQLPYRVGMHLQRALDVPVASYVLLLRAESLGLAGEVLTFNGMMDTQLGQAATYVAGPLEAGEPLVFTLLPQSEVPAMASETGAVSTSAVPPTRSPALEVGIGLVALVLAGMTAFRLWQPARVPPMPETARPFVAELAALDARYADGTIAEAAYREQRATLIQRLRAHLEA